VTYAGILSPTGTIVPFKQNPLWEANERMILGAEARTNWGLFPSAFQEIIIKTHILDGSSTRGPIPTTYQPRSGPITWEMP
jgi:hypothetical protein